MDRKIQIDTFSRYSQVSRETIRSLIKYEKLLIKGNKNLNLIGSSTINYIWHRHFLDSLQVIDFIDKNQKTLVDLGSGAGFPGLVMSIVAKERKIPDPPSSMVSGTGGYEIITAANPPKAANPITPALNIPAYPS